MSVAESGPDLMLPGPSPLRAPSKTPSSLDTLANENTEAQKAERGGGALQAKTALDRKFRPSREEPQSGKPHLLVSPAAPVPA